MTVHERLEARLKVLDLRFDDDGDHLDDNRIAEIGEGADPSGDEARHLAGCDECVDLLVVLGAGLETLADEAPDVAAWMSPSRTTRPTAPAKRGRWVGVAVFFAAAIALAAASWPQIWPKLMGGADDGATKAPAKIAPPPAQPEASPSEALNAPTPDTPTALPVPPTAPETASTIVGDLMGSFGRLAALDDALLRPLTYLDSLPPPAQPRRAVARRRAVLEVGELGRHRGPKAFNRAPIDGRPTGYGQLQINATPPARVFIGGRDLGWTPLLNVRLPEGPQDARLVYESPLAAEPEQRFRLVIQNDKVLRVVRKNVKQ